MEDAQKPVLFACDLDNTLIHSYAHKLPQDVCVERLDGQMQSYMTPRAVQLLKTVSAVTRFVPVTTRSIAQYRRIQWPDGCTVFCAVVTHGGVCLHGGDERTQWRQRFAERAAPYQTAMSARLQRFQKTDAYQKCRMVDGMYLCVPCADAQTARTCASDGAGDGLCVSVSGRKAYFLPPGLDKGAALELLRKAMNPTFVIAAGDSSMDLPMLERADLALVPDAALAEKLHRPNRRICPAERHFSEFVLETILEFV